MLRSSQRERIYNIKSLSQIIHAVFISGIPCREPWTSKLCIKTAATAGLQSLSLIQSPDIDIAIAHKINCFRLHYCYFNIHCTIKNNKDTNLAYQSKYYKMLNVNFLIFLSSRVLSVITSMLIIQTHNSDWMTRDGYAPIDASELKVARNYEIPYRWRSVMTLVPRFASMLQVVIFQRMLQTMPG